MGQMFEGGDQFCLGLLGRARDTGEAGDSKGIAFSLVMSSPEVFSLFVCFGGGVGLFFPLGKFSSEFHPRPTQMLKHFSPT